MINKNFALLLSGQLVSQIGDKFHMIAIAMWVLKTTGSSAKMGLVLAASLLPSLILGLVSGAFIDRFNRKAIIVGADLIRGGVIAVFALLFCFDMISFAGVLVMQVILSMNAAFFDPAIPSIIPTIVPAEKLADANSKHQFVNGFSTIAGAFLGGVAITAFGYIWVFIINGVSFFISGIFECFISLESQRSENKSRLSLQNIFCDLKSGYTYILSRSTLLILLFMVMIIHFFVGSMEVFMPVIAGALSSGGAGALGFFHGAFGSGCIAMAFALSFIDISKKEKTTLFGSVFVIGALYVGGSFFNMNNPAAFYLFCSMIFLFGAGIIMAGVSFKTLLQKRIDNAFAGRVFAVAGSVGNASIPLAMILYGLMLEKIQIRPLLMISGLVLMLISGVSIVLYKEKNHGGTGQKVPAGATKN